MIEHSGKATQLGSGNRVVRYHLCSVNNDQGPDSDRRGANLPSIAINGNRPVMRHVRRCVIDEHKSRGECCPDKPDSKNFFNSYQVQLLSDEEAE